MEQHIEKFKNYVLGYLKKASKKSKIPLEQLSLGFYLGKIELPKEEEQEEDADDLLGVGYILAKGVVTPAYMIAKEHDDAFLFFSAVLNPKTGKYEYEWSSNADNIAFYNSEEKAEEVNDRLSLDGEVYYMGSVEAAAKWRNSVGGSCTEIISEDDEYKELAYPDIDEILDILFDIMGLKNIVPPMIHQSLMMMSSKYAVEPINLRVYVCPISSKDVKVLVFEDRQFIAPSSLEEVVFSIGAME